jgi:dGTPase
MTLEIKDYYRKGMNKIYYYYLDAIKREDKNNIIYKLFLNNQDTSYLNNTDPRRMVIDFIAGMTDDMFLREIERIN